MDPSIPTFTWPAIPASCSNKEQVTEAERILQRLERPERNSPRTRELKDTVAEAMVSRDAVAERLLNTEKPTARLEPAARRKGGLRAVLRRGLAQHYLRPIPCVKYDVAHAQHADGQRRRRRQVRQQHGRIDLPAFSAVGDVADLDRIIQGHLRLAVLATVGCAGIQDLVGQDGLPDLRVG